MSLELKSCFSVALILLINTLKITNNSDILPTLK